MDVPDAQRGALSFYTWRHQIETTSAARRRVLGEHIRRIFDLSRRTYGCRRVAAALHREGRRASVGLVAELLRELGLRTCQLAPTSAPRCLEQPGSSPDRLERDFAAVQTSQRLVGDITSSRPAKAGCIWPR